MEGKCKYSTASNKELAKMLTGELNLHMLNDTAAREKIAEAIRRLSSMPSESKIIIGLRKELAAKTKKLDKICAILET